MLAAYSLGELARIGMYKSTYALMVLVICLQGGCTASRQGETERRTSEFLNELERIKVSHLFQDEQFSDIVRHLEKSTGVRFVYSSENFDNRRPITYHAQDLYSTICALSAVLDVQWGVKGRTVYLGRNLQGLDYVSTSF